MTDPSRPTVEDLKRQEVRALEHKGRRNVDKKFNTLQELQVEYVDPESIYPNAYNPNRQTEKEFDLLCSSMLEDGFTQPILVHLKTREIVDGEHRWRASQRLGLKEIPVVFVDMTLEQMRISTLRHNRARGSEDIELTIKVLQDLRALGSLEHAVDSLGMSDRELNALIDDIQAPDQLAGDEFSDSWVPTPEVPNDGDEDFKGRTISISPGIRREQERLKTKTDGAENEEEHQTLMRSREHVPNRMSVVLQPEDLPLFTEVLGDAPAQTLLALIRFDLHKRGKRYGLKQATGEIHWLN